MTTPSILERLKDIRDAGKVSCREERDALHAVIVMLERLIRNGKVTRGHVVGHVGVSGTVPGLEVT